MTGRTHDLAAATALLAVVIVYPPASLNLTTVVAALIANQIGGIAPDIDQPTAPLWRNLPVAGIFGKFFGKLLGGHRFLTHSLLGLAGAGFLLDMFLNFISQLVPAMDTGYVWWAFMIGMVSHLVMDSFTKDGVPWLLPLPFRIGFPPLRKLRLTTGKLGEMALIFPGLILVNIWLVASHYDYVLGLIQKHIQ